MPSFSRFGRTTFSKPRTTYFRVSSAVIIQGYTVPLDHELKLRRAFKHLQDLDREVKAWIAGDHHTVRYEYDPDARWRGPVPRGGRAEPPDSPDPEGVVFRLAYPVFIPGVGPQTPPPGVAFGEGHLVAHAVAEKPPLDPFSLLIGDCLHNLRSALDVLAFSLASAYTKPLPKDAARSSEFPIFGDEDGQGSTGIGSVLFHQKTPSGNPARRSGVSKIRAWHPDAQAIVERLQPYHRGNDFRSNELWILHELDRINKHRLLHTTTGVSAGTLWHIPGAVHTRGPKNVRCIGPGFVRTFRRTIETEAPITEFWGIHRVDPNGEMDMDVEPALEVAFDFKAPVVAGYPVLRCLTDIYIHVGGTIFPALAPFL